MTVTVIIIIAVIVVLAVLVLLLLGMRALSLGSRDNDYDDEYEYDDIEDDREGRRDRGRARGEAPEDEEDGSRSRGRRPRPSGGRAERRPQGRRQRGVDWADDSDGLSDNDFWSSLSEDGPAQPGPRDRDAFDVGDTGGYPDDYDDEPERGGPAAPGFSGGFDDTPDQVRTPPGSNSNLAMLASLGQSGTPIPPPEQPSSHDQRPPALGPSPSNRALPPTQGLPQNQPPVPAIPSAPQDDDPLGPGSWPPRPPSTGDPFEGREPLTPAERGGLSDGDRPGGDYDSGSYTLGRAPSSSGPGDPLDPGFRPDQSSGADLSSPIWSSMDTGAHQRPDLSGYEGRGSGSSGGFGSLSDTGAMPTPGQPMGGPSIPGRHTSGLDPLTGGHPSGGFRSGSPYDPNAASTDPFARPEYDTGSFSQPGYDTGTHQPNPYDTGTHNRPTGLGHPSPYDTGAHTRPTGPGGPSPYDSGTFARPGYDTGTHQPNPYDSGTHNRPTGLGDPNPYDTPGAPGGPILPSGPPAGNPPLWGGPPGGGAYDTPNRPTPGPGAPGWSPAQPPGKYPIDSGYGSEAYQGEPLGGRAPYQERPQQTDPFGRPLGGPQGPGVTGAQGPPGGPGHQGGPGHPGGQSNYSDMLGGDVPPSDYGYPPAQNWRPGEEPGDGLRHSGPIPRTGQDPYGHDSRSGYGQEYYEGGYEDGQYR